LIPTILTPTFSKDMLPTFTEELPQTFRKDLPPAFSKECLYIKESLHMFSGTRHVTKSKYGGIE
jgi:hypothetical protein